MHTVFRWLLGMTAVAGLAVFLIWAFLEGRLELAREGEMEKPIKARANVARDSKGNALVTLGDDSRRRIKLATAALIDATLQPEVVAYGALEEDPLLTFTLRAPITGKLYSSDAAWPEIGMALENHSVVGHIKPIWDPAQRIDLASRLATAQGSVDEHRAHLAAARASFEHKKALNKEGERQIVAERTIEETEAQVKMLEAQLHTAMQTVRLIESAFSATGQPDELVRVETEQGGQVINVIAKPGEIVEAGQEILRLARFDRLIARVELPAGETLDYSVSTARILVLGHEDHPLVGQAIGVAPTVNPNTRGQAFLFRVEGNGFPIRPGISVTAHIERPGAPLHGVVIPRSAVVRTAGAAWAFVQISKGKFVQREVAINHPVRAGWFTVSGFAPDEHVVVEGAQVLLSEILKSRIRVGEEEQ